MSSNMIFTDFAKDLEKYLKGKLPEATDDTIGDISSYVAYKTVVLVNDIERERIRREHEVRYSRAKPLLRKYTLDNESDEEKENV